MSAALCRWFDSLDHAMILSAAVSLNHTNAIVVMFKCIIIVFYDFYCIFRYESTTKMLKIQ